MSFDVVLQVVAIPLQQMTECKSQYTRTPVAVTRLL
jgi:hypothetical protein